MGLIALRRTGIYFAMITVAISEVFFYLEFNPLSEWTGGENGLTGVPAPVFSLFGYTHAKFKSGWTLYPFVALFFFIGIVIALRIVRSPVGVVFPRHPREPVARRRCRPRNQGLQAGFVHHRRCLCRPGWWAAGANVKIKIWRSVNGFSIR